MNSAASVRFGFPEFWKQFHAKFGPVLDVLGRHQAALNGIVNRGYEAVDGWQRCVLNLGMLTGVGMTELLTLAENGCGHGAMKILRSMLENTIDAEFLRLDPARFGDYLNWDGYER